MIRTHPGSRSSFDDRSHLLRFVVLAVCVALLSGCVTPPVFLPAPEPLLSPRDSTALAYETGRRDALLLHRPRTAAVALSVALPLGLAATRATGEFWAAPATASGVALSASVWAHRQTRRPLPLAPDSMRSRYSLDDVFLWSRYQRGFQDAIDQQRRAEFQRSAQTTAVVILVTGLTYFAFRPRD